MPLSAASEIESRPCSEVINNNSFNNISYINHITNLFKQIVSAFFLFLETIIVSRSFRGVNKEQDLRIQGCTNHVLGNNHRHCCSQIINQNDLSISAQERRIQLIEALVNNPSSLLNGQQMQEYDAIRECHCIPAFSRIGSQDENLRMNFEELLLQNIEEKFPDKERPITLCSFASGGCFQELVLHAKLCNKGYQVNWVLVDRGFENSNNQSYQANSNTMNQAQELFRLIDCRTQLTFKNDAEKFFSTENSLSSVPDVFLCIDSDLRGKVVPISEQDYNRLKEKQTQMRPYSGYLSLLAKLAGEIACLERPVLFGYMENSGLKIESNVQSFGFKSIQEA